MESDRLILLGPDGLAGGHLELYGRMDIALDTFPWNGHLTSCEAMWMGVPVLTLASERHAGRMCASVLNQIGLEHLVAQNAEQFVEIAARLAGSPRELEKVRGVLRDRMLNSVACDGRRFAAEFEQALRRIWSEWCST